MKTKILAALLAGVRCSADFVLDVRPCHGCGEEL